MAVAGIRNVVPDLRGRSPGDGCGRDLRGDGARHESPDAGDRNSAGSGRRVWGHHAAGAAPGITATDPGDGPWGRRGSGSLSIDGTSVVQVLTTGSDNVRARGDNARDCGTAGLLDTGAPRGKTEPGARVEIRVRGGVFGVRKLACAL